MLQVEFEKNSEENDQESFGYKLISFDSSGLQIKIGFSDPLLVSQGDVADQVKIRFHKSYFMEPEPQDLGRLLSNGIKIS